MTEKEYQDMKLELTATLSRMVSEFIKLNKVLEKHREVAKND